MPYPAPARRRVVVPVPVPVPAIPPVSGGLPTGVFLAGPDAPSQTYWANWTNTFPAVNTFIPIGQFPSDIDAYSTLATVGVNFTTPMRDDQASAWRPVQSQAGSHDMGTIIAQAGVYAGACFWYYCQPGVPANATTVSGLGSAITLPNASFTLPVASMASWTGQSQRMSNPWNAVANVPFLGQIVVQSSTGPVNVNFNGISGTSFTGCSCTTGSGTISNGATVGGANWGSKAAFNSIGDEIDGNAPGGVLDGAPLSLYNIVAANVGSWGGCTAAGFASLYSAAKAIDSTRPQYLQLTGTFTGNINSFGSQYTLAQQKQTMNSCDIFSFDRYLVADLGVPVYYRYDEMLQLRYLAGYSKPILAFTEVGLISGYTHTPTPAQTVSLNWNSIVGGGGGYQYFDGAGSNPNLSTSGAMQTAVTNFNALMTSLAPVINSPFAYGFVTVLSGITAPVSSTASTTLSDGSTGTHVLLSSAPSLAPYFLAGCTFQGVSGAGAQAINKVTSCMLTVNSSTDIVVSTGTTGPGSGGTIVMSPAVSAHYYALTDSFYVFVAPHDSTLLSYTLAFADITGVTSMTKVDIQTGSTTTVNTDSSGHLAITFADVNQGCYLIIPNPH